MERAEIRRTELEPLLSLAEAGRTLGISRSGIWRLIGRGELTVVRVGNGRTLIEPSAVRTYIEGHRFLRTDDEARQAAPGFADSAETGGGDDAA